MVFNKIINKLRFLLLRFKAASLQEIVYKIKEYFFILLYSHKNMLSYFCHDIYHLNEVKLPTFFSSGPVKKDHISYSAFWRQQIENFEASQHKKSFFRITVPPNFDIRIAWEGARLQNISARLITAREAGNEESQAEVLTTAGKHLLAWLAHNPFPLGPHYVSAMECGLRIPVFILALKRLTGLQEKERQDITQAIWNHAWWIEHRLSRFSSRGNHTVCEGLGLIFAGAIFLPIACGQRWLTTGISLLEQELPHQILPDGGPVEQAIGYHRFVLDAYWLALDFLTNNALYDCSGWLSRLQRGEHFLQFFALNREEWLQIGDSDDGFVIAPGIVPQRSAVPPPTQFLQTFPEAGYSVMRGKHGLLVTFDHGPLGMPPLYGHGHADALAITLSIGGRTILVDPGTYRYNGVPAFRRYFKSTRAHNTVTIDGLDQAVQETGFIWSRPYQATLLAAGETSQGIFLSAVHDGYARLPQPVWHQRRIFYSDGAMLLIHDTFQGEGFHTFELNYHCHPEALVKEHHAGWEISRGEVAIFIRFETPGKVCLINGDENPPFGWFSERYGYKTPCPVLSCRWQGEPSDISFLTAIQFETVGNISLP